MGVRDVVAGLDRKTIKMTYNKVDVSDYFVMVGITHFFACQIYTGPLQLLSAFCSTFLAVGFLVRHGAVWKLPTLMRQPGSLISLAVELVRTMSVFCILRLLLAIAEHKFVELTPTLSHYSEEISTISEAAWYLHLSGMTAFRLCSTWYHLIHRKHVKNFLLSSDWKKVLGNSAISFHIIHACVTGVYSNIMLIMPWYARIKMLKVSIYLLLPTLFLDIWWVNGRKKSYGRWYYEDHEHSHQNTIHFLYLHGPHHDALPICTIAAHSTGMLEALHRGLLGSADSYLGPIWSFVSHTAKCTGDMRAHQYVPGVFPYAKFPYVHAVHHAVHHFLSLYPLGAAAGDAIKLDEELNGYNKSNEKWMWWKRQVEIIEGLDSS